MIVQFPNRSASIRSKVSNPLDGAGMLNIYREGEDSVRISGSLKIHEALYASRAVFYALTEERDRGRIPDWALIQTIEDFNHIEEIANASVLGYSDLEKPNLSIDIPDFKDLKVPNRLLRKATRPFRMLGRLGYYSLTREDPVNIPKLIRNSALHLDLKESELPKLVINDASVHVSARAAGAYSPQNETVYMANDGRILLKAVLSMVSSSLSKIAFIPPISTVIYNLFTHVEELLQGLTTHELAHRRQDIKSKQLTRAEAIESFRQAFNELDGNGKDILLEGKTIDDRINDQAECFARYPDIRVEEISESSLTRAKNTLKNLFKASFHSNPAFKKKHPRSYAVNPAEIEARLEDLSFKANEGITFFNSVPKINRRNRIEFLNGLDRMLDFLSEYFLNTLMLNIELAKSQNKSCAKLEESLMKLYKRARFSVPAKALLFEELVLNKHLKG
jgi:hypothetical protein